MHRNLAALLVALCLVGSSGCTRVPATPRSARDQPPSAAPAGPWRAHGRIAVIAGGNRLSARLHLLRDESGLRIAAVSDSGVVLLEATLTPATVTVLRDRLQRPALVTALTTLLDHALVRPADAEGSWTAGRWLAGNEAFQRWYGGDPVLLRQVDLGGTRLHLGDWRINDSQPVPFHLMANGRHLDLEVVLQRWWRPPE